MASTSNTTHGDSTDKVISNVFGTLGAICWSIQLLPQIILNYRRHSAAGLSPTFMLFWACAGIPLGVYNIVQNFNLALQIQPQILTFLSLVTWGQCRYYNHQPKNLRPSVIIALLLALIFGGIEAALIFALRNGLQNGTTWPLTLMAVLAALFLALGVLEQYLAVYKSRSVRGISFLFCGIDALGDVTSIVSVCFEPQLRVVGLVGYGVELVLWVGIFGAGVWFGMAPWVRKAVAKDQVREDGGGDVEGGSAGVALGEMPSSTSVFRTASNASDLRERRPNIF